MNPYEEREFLDGVHKNAALGENLEILFGDATVGGSTGGSAFLPLYQDCLEKTGTPVGPWKVFQRALRALTLARYFEYSLSLDGGRAECGVYRGFTGLLLCRIAAMREAGFSGEGLHLIDSFEGLSAPTPPDALATREFPDGRKEPHYGYDQGHFDTHYEEVRAVFSDYPAATVHKGWIPEVFAQLPEQRWAFVHIDVDLYAPTKACLDYFVPRMVPGGVIVNDDFQAPFFPGCGRAWYEFFKPLDLPYVVLDSGQSVFTKPAE